MQQTIFILSDDIQKYLDKIVCVPYLNSHPLIYNIKDKIAFDIPSNLVHRLNDNSSVSALIPIFDYFCFYQKNWDLVKNIGICCRGNVDSVYLVYDKNFNIKDLKKIYLHNESSTSVNLLKIILMEFYKIYPKFIGLNKDTIFEKGNEIIKDKNGILVIGDSAINFREKHKALKYLDLGGSWNEFTNLPFVFACWVINNNYKNQTSGYEFKIANFLRESHKKSYKMMEEIIKKQNILKSENARDYLTNKLHYSISGKEIMSMNLFKSYCHKHDLLSEENYNNIKYNWI